MKKGRSSIVIGVLFILVGLLYLGSILNFWPFIGFWSIGILIGSIVLGIVCLLSKNFIGGFFFIGVFISRFIDYLPHPYDNIYHISFWNIMVLAIVFGIGVQMLYNSTNSRRSQKRYQYKNYGSRNKYYGNNEQADEADFDTVIDVEFDSNQKNEYTGSDELNRIFIDSSFKDVTRYVTSQSFNGGEINNSFGQVTLHLTQAMLDANGAHLAIHCSFGQVKIYVPRAWAVNNKISETIFSSVNDDRADFVDGTVPNLAITGSVNFGEIKILYV